MKLPHCALRVRLRAGLCCCIYEPSQFKGVESFVGEAPTSIALDPCVETDCGGEGDDAWVAVGSKAALRSILFYGN